VSRPCRGNLNVLSTDPAGEKIVEVDMHVCLIKILPFFGTKNQPARVYDYLMIIVVIVTVIDSSLHRLLSFQKRRNRNSHNNNPACFGPGRGQPVTKGGEGNHHHHDRLVLRTNITNIIIMSGGTTTITARGRNETPALRSAAIDGADVESGKFRFE
jgi:hypothetical protein